MRLMLSTANSEPSLLVEVTDDYNPIDFKFWVVNGGWLGRFVNGDMTVDGHSDGEVRDTGMTISCDTQSRLHGDYNDVFNNFDNVDYAAPIPEPIDLSHWDDDIAF
jgi:hypothetical protein